MKSMADVVVLGAGPADMTAAYKLRDLDLVVLEGDDGVGGRTFSRESPGGWYSAQSGTRVAVDSAFHTAQAVSAILAAR